jgi:polar amino acid transport system substrate-binding protein
MRLVACAVVVASCSHFPADPGDTTERVQRGVMRVGVVPNGAFARDAEHGVELDLARAFAQSLGAEARFTIGTESELVRALKERELDLVIGGLVDDDPQLEKVGVTKPYVRVKSCIGVPAGDDLDPRMTSVAVRIGDPAAATLESKGVHRLPAISRNDAPVLAPDYRLEAWGLVLTRHCPREEAHVLAVPPGENRFLLRLEHFLDGHRDAHAALVAEEKRP